MHDNSRTDVKGNRHPDMRHILAGGHLKTSRESPFPCYQTPLGKGHIGKAVSAVSAVPAVPATPAATTPTPPIMKAETFPSLEPPAAQLDGIILSQVMKITPEVAAKCLERNDKNRRKMNLGRAQHLANEILSGRWELNGESIKFDVNGDLVDGQHRLFAVVLANVPIEALIVQGIAVGNDRAIDVGHPRSFRDHLAYLGEKDSKTLASAVMYQWRYEHQRGPTVQITIRPSFLELEEVLKRHPELRTSVSKAGRCASIITSGIPAFLHYQFSLRDPEMADRFFEALSLGSNLSKNDPVLLLRDMLQNSNKAPSGQGLSREFKYALIVKAWNYWRQGRTVTRLGYRPFGVNPEAFPEIQ